MMESFEFLLGDWNLDYQIPESSYSKACTATGKGSMRRFLNDKYVTFDYESTMEEQTGGAHGIFAWDPDLNLYRYWWFEDSGNFQDATCKFVNENTLFMNWNDTLLIQTFTKTGPDEVVLSMEEPDENGEYKPILKVILRRK